MESTSVCKNGTNGQCLYYNYVRGHDDGLDVVALLISYLVLWVNPEITLFPVGLALYVIPCIFNAIKFAHRSSAASGLKWINGVSVAILGILSFFGINGSLSCCILENKNMIILNKSMISLINVEKVPTLWLLVLAGVPFLFTVIRYFFVKSKVVKE